MNFWTMDFTITDGLIISFIIFQGIFLYLLFNSKFTSFVLLISKMESKASKNQENIETLHVNFEKYVASKDAKDYLLSEKLTKMEIEQVRLSGFLQENLSMLTKIVDRNTGDIEMLKIYSRK